MSDDTELSRLADAHGILSSYRDMRGQVQEATPATFRALLSAIGVASENRKVVREGLAAFRAKLNERRFPEELIVESRRGGKLTIGATATWLLRSEETGEVVADGRADDTISLPAMPSGVYAIDLTVSGHHETTRIIAAPARAPGIRDIVGSNRVWGLNLALYGLRSRRNTGMGDFSDLTDFARVAGKMGASFVGVNPVHAMGYSSPASSPYSPSHRGFLNTAHIAPDAVPGLDASPAARRVLAGAESAFDELRTSDLVSYGRHRSVHQGLLDALYTAFLTDAPDWAQSRFAAFRKERGNTLAQFARFEAASAVAPAGSSKEANPQNDLQHGGREVFHSWLQWVADRQLAIAQKEARRAGVSLGLYLDLAVGARRDGAEEFCERRSIARNVSVGAPPDHLNPGGQNWNLIAYIPQKLAAQSYRPIQRFLAGTMRHAGIVRIDHMLGLSRSFWLPDDGSPGGYVRQPFDAFLAILKIEAERSGTAVIGEDLGLVPQGFRTSLRDNGIHGYSVIQYERDETGGIIPGSCPSADVMACFSTHDTPTVRGFETGRDIHWQRKLGWIGENECARAKLQRQDDIRTLVGERHSADFTTTVNTLLARSPATMVSIQLDDILGHEDAQNLPGTTVEHMNWRRKYRVPIEDLSDDARIQSVSVLMNNERGTINPSLDTGKPGRRNHLTR